MDFEQFRFCPHCGRSNSLQFTDRKITCPECNFEFYINIAAAVAAIIFKEDQLLLVRRGREPRKGKLDFPGGFVDLNEPAEQALHREIREELNLEITDLQLFGTFPNTYRYKDFVYPVLDLYFSCRAVDTVAARAQDDAADYNFYRLEDISPHDLSFASTRNVFEKLCAGAGK